jgi:hypothetical protein
MIIYKKNNYYKKMVTLQQIDEVVKFINDYMNDSKKPTKTSFYCPRGSFNLLKQIKNQIDAQKGGKNAIIKDYLTIYIFNKNQRWHIHIKNNDLIEPRGPM